MVPTVLERMTSSTADTSSWLPRHQDALLLSNLLRVSRLTLLYGEAGAGKTSLLKNELLPTLRRRASDLQLGQGRRFDKARVVVPFPDRRSGGRFAGRSEVAVLFDGWNRAVPPLAGLHTCIEDALGLRRTEAPVPHLPLAERLVLLGCQHNAHLLIVLDGFDAHLAVSSDDIEARRFDDELVQALNRAEVPAHFFISVRDESRPLLGPLRARVAGFGDRWLRVRHWRGLRPDGKVSDQEESAQNGSAWADTLPCEYDGAPFEALAAAAPQRPASSLLLLPSLDMPASSGSEGDTGLDLYLPLEPRDDAPSSSRVQALWDELLTSASSSNRAAAAMAAAADETEAEREGRTERVADAPPPAPQEHATPGQAPVAAGQALSAPNFSRWRKPWMIWSLLVVAVAAVMIGNWAESLLTTPATAPTGKRIATGVEPPRTATLPAPESPPQSADPAASQ